MVVITNVLLIEQNISHILNVFSNENNKKKVFCFGSNIYALFDQWRSASFLKWWVRVNNFCPGPGLVIFLLLEGKSANSWFGKFTPKIPIFLTSSQKNLIMSG